RRSTWSPHYHESPAADDPVSAGCGNHIRHARLVRIETERMRMPADTRLFLCLKDNYGVLLHDPESGATAAIDAPEAGPIEAALNETGWRLSDILVTHHHADHTGGIEA